MSSSRRRFLKYTALAGTGFVLGPSVLSSSVLSSSLLSTSLLSTSIPNNSVPGNSGQIAPAAPITRQGLKILILGGTSFIGPHLIKHALDQGHEVSIFTRGRSVPTVHADLLNHVEKLIGDRQNDLSALEGRQWDIVIDNSGKNVNWTRDSATLLAENAGMYVYTSSTGVYYPYLNPPIAESRDLAMEVPAVVSGDEKAEYTYGVMKTRSEIEARSAFGDDRTLIIRPTYIIGPGDSGNRFQHWPVRIERGGEILVPGNPDDAVQWIDVRDLAAFMIEMAEKKQSGTYNVVGPSSKMGIQACVHGIHAATSSRVEWVPIPDYDFLLEHGISYIVPWIMPRGNNLGSARVSAIRAVENGLTFTPLATTTMDILDWWHSDTISDKRRSSLTDGDGSLFQREAEIIKAWRSRG